MESLDLENINAPQYFDFSEPTDDFDHEDYFAFDHENNTPVVMSDSGNSSMYLDAADSASPSVVTKNTPKSKVLKSGNKPEATAGSANKLSAGSSGQKTEKTTSNICASLSAWRKRTQKVLDTEVRRSPRLQTGEQKANGSSKRSQASPALRQPRRSAAQTTAAQPAPRQLSKSPLKRTFHSRTRSVDTSTTATGAPTAPKLQRSGSVRLLSRKPNTGEGEKKYNAPSSIGSKTSDGGKKSTTPSSSDNKTKRSLTNSGSKPKIPSVLSKESKAGAPTTGKIKTTEQLEMEKIREFQKALVQKRKAQENFRQKAMAAKSALKPLPSSKAPTRVEEFHFKSDSRVKSQDRRSCEHDEKEFKDKLRSSSPALQKEHALVPKKTIPHPFSFDKKRKRPSDQVSSQEAEDKPDKFVPMAEQIKKFTGTPERFRSRPVNKEPSPAKRRRRSMSQPNVRLTVAHTPQLQTRGRTRPVNIKSQAELEEEELQLMQKCKFRAKPVNEKIFENSCLGVKKVEPRKATVIQEFDLESGRHGNSLKNRSHEEERYEFHAKPIPKGILDGPTGVKPSQKMPVTLPASPAFALKNRLRSSIKVPEVLPEEKEKPVKAKPAPHHGLPYLPKFDRRSTELEPFSFEERNKRMLQQTREKLRRIQEEENKPVPEFHAKPMPDHNAPLPPKLTKPSTTPMPFQLEVDARGAMKAEEWSSKIKEELKEKRSKANFKAQPNRANCEMFVPKPSMKPLTILEDVTLNTDVRAVDREQWEEWKHEKELQEEELRQQRDEIQHQHEHEEIERLRKEMETHAQPIRKYKPVTVKKAGKPLTKPHTPKFSDRLSNRTVRL